MCPPVPVAWCWATMPPPVNGAANMDKRLLNILVCPVSKGKLVLVGDELWCRSSGLAYPIRNDIPVMLESEARHLSLDEVESIKDRDR